MGNKGRLNEETRWAIVHHRKEGKGYKTIASYLGIDKKTVKNTWNRYLDTGGVGERKGRGRKRATTKREDTAIVKMIKRCRMMSAKTCQQELETLSGTKISRETVNRRILEGKLQSRKAFRVPGRDKFQKKRRLQWALEFSSWTTDDWEKVPFSDESRFCLASDQPTRVRRTKD